MNGFQFQASSSTCEDLIRAFPRSNCCINVEVSALIDDLEIIAYWEESGWSSGDITFPNSFIQSGDVVAVQPQENVVFTLI